MIEVTLKDGKKTKRATNIDRLRGDRIDQVVLVFFDRGWHIHNQVTFTYLLRKGTELTFLKGQVDMRGFHELSMALRQILPPGVQIDQID